MTPERWEVMGLMGGIGGSDMVVTSETGAVSLNMDGSKP